MGGGGSKEDKKYKEDSDMYVSAIKFEDFTLHRFEEVYGMQVIPEYRQGITSVNVSIDDLSSGGAVIKSLDREKNGIFLVYGKCSPLTRAEEKQ